MGGAPSHILNDSLIQGGSDVLSDVAWFKSKRITHVVSICDEYPRDSIIPPHCRLHIDLLDSPSTDLSAHFDACIRFIHEARRDGGRVYVHCAAGISRSSTIVLAYLMAWLEMDFDEALAALRLARQAVSPNDGFRRQLREFCEDPRCRELRQLLKAEREANEELKKLHAGDLGCLEARKSPKSSLGVPRTKSNSLDYNQKLRILNQMKDLENGGGSMSTNGEISTTTTTTTATSDGDASSGEETGDPQNSSNEDDKFWSF